VSKPADDPILQGALSNAVEIPYWNYAFRVIPGSSVVHEIHFEHLWEGAGAGRCNPDGVKRLHLSVEKETAQAEFLYYAAKGGLDPNLADSYSFAVEVRLGRVLDLTSKKIRKHLSITLDEIRADWEVDPLLHPPPTPTKLQGIGYWVSKGHGRFSAILYPSRRKRGGRNLVLFKSQMGPRDFVTPFSSVPTKGWP
jgi:RES domain-containing protein